MTALTPVNSSLPAEIKGWLLKTMNLTPDDILAIRQLKGSTSSLIYNITLKTEEIKQEVVLRIFNDKAWLQNEPDLAIHEIAALNFAFKNNINSPMLIAVDEQGRYSKSPAVLMSKLEGEVILRPKNIINWIDELAKNLVQIHSVNPHDFKWKYFTYNKMDSLSVPKWSDHKKYWQQLIAIAKSPFPAFEKRFIHRDYHPANVLWKNAEMSGIVDWVNACIGPAGIDLGHCRLNLSLLHGVQVADQFLDAYQKYASVNFNYDPYWDIISLMDFEVNELKIYPGWSAFGVNDLTEQIIKYRLDEYAISLVIRIENS